MKKALIVIFVISIMLLSACSERPVQQQNSSEGQSSSNINSDEIETIEPELSENDTESSVENEPEDNSLNSLDIENDSVNEEVSSSEPSALEVPQSSTESASSSEAPVSSSSEQPSDVSSSSREQSSQASQSSSQASSAPSSSQPSSQPAESSTNPLVPPLPQESEPSFNELDNTQSSQSTAQDTQENSSNQSNNNTQTETDEVRAVWISYLDFYSLLQNKSESEFKRNIDNAFNNIIDSGFNTAIVQVRPFADALYPSDYFPWSHIINKEVEGVDPGFDPLEIMVEAANEMGIRIEAWINPYRVRATSSMPEPANNSPAVTLANTDAVIHYGDGIYFNPASEAARDLITNGVMEIVNNYDIDAIHFDDYFYPTTDAAFDSDSYNAYRSSGGNMSLENWRRENVNILIKQVYSAINAVSSKVEFGVSPQANFENNYDKQYIDVAKWLSTPGYVDYICPQVYFGFENETYPFEYTVNAWNDLIEVNGIDLYIGMSPYKIGTEDTWAGTGKQEWITDEDILARMVETARDLSEYEGFFMYRYDSLYNPSSSVSSQVQSELNELEKIM